MNKTPERKPRILGGEEEGVPSGHPQPLGVWPPDPTSQPPPPHPISPEFWLLEFVPNMMECLWDHAIERVFGDPGEEYMKVLNEDIKKTTYCDEKQSHGTKHLPMIKSNIYRSTRQQIAIFLQLLHRNLKPINVWAYRGSFLPSAFAFSVYRVGVEGCLYQLPHGLWVTPDHVFPFIMGRPLIFQGGATQPAIPELWKDISNLISSPPGATCTPFLVSRNGHMRVSRNGHMREKDHSVHRSCCKGTCFVDCGKCAENTVPLWHK
jgi:hypothetical protein